MEAKQYRVIKDHTSEYPEPITFAKGAPLVVGEPYEGSEGWSNWLFCQTPGQKGGWVPAQIVEIVSDKTARAREDYTARELDVREGDLLLGTRTLNGWVWCKSTENLESGWVRKSSRSTSVKSGRRITIHSSGCRFPGWLIVNSRIMRTVSPSPQHLSPRERD